MFGENFKTGKPIEFEKPIKAYVLKSYGKKYILILRFQFLSCNRKIRTRPNSH